MVGEKLNILIVDDERRFLEQAGIFLKNEDRDFNIYQEDSVEKGIEIVEQENIDIIVSDYQMPGEDGLEFLEKIRKEKGKKTPFIIFTGKGREEVAIKALNLGADRYLQKGGDPRTQYGVLARTIKKEVEHNKTEKEVEHLRNEYRELFNSVKDMVFIHDLNGEIIQVNETAVDVLGYDKEELLKMNIKEIDKEQEKTIDRLEILKNENSIKFEGKHITKSGEILPVEINANIIDFRGEKAVLGAARDITERKRKEDFIKHLNEVINVVRKINQLIVIENDKNPLLNKTTEKLVKSNLFDKAWIGLIDDEKCIDSVYISGVGDIDEREKFDQMIDDNFIPNCIERVFDEKEMVVIDEGEEVCEDCPFFEGYTDNYVISIKLDYENEDYGVMNISFSDDIDVYPSKREFELIQELADDLGYALYNIEKEELKEEMRNVERLADTSGSYQRLIDENFNIFAQNEDMKELTSISDEEIEENDFKCYDQLRGPSCNNEECTLKKVQNGEEIIHREVEKITADGEKIKAIMTAKPVKDEEGNVIGVAESFKDISSIKSIIENMKDTIKEFEKGKLNNRVSTENLEKDYQALAKGVNELFEMVEDCYS